ncbi:MAG: EamA family transporter [Tepidisphaeraceae bacterium]
MIGFFELALTALFVLLETIEHCLYRLGSGHRRAWLFFGSGMALNVIGMGIWLVVLRTATLGQVLPLLATTNVTVALAGYFFFREKVTPRRWIGILLITGGVALVSSAIL